MSKVDLFFKRDWKLDILTWLSFIGIGLAIIGVPVFGVSIIKFGFQWWNVIGTVGSIIACCIPMILEISDTKSQKENAEN